VRALPARPATCAAFAQWQRDLGVPKEKISATLSAIEALHFAAGQSNPVAIPLVRTTTAASTIEPPRSWAREEQQLFTQLPVEIQVVVSRRERDRETTLRRGQNEVAELKKLIRLQAAAETKTADTEKDTTIMAKEKGVGPYAGQDKDSKVRKDDSALGYHKPVDILKRVEGASKNDGFAGKLPNND